MIGQNRCSRLRRSFFGLLSSEPALEYACLLVPGESMLIVPPISAIRFCILTRPLPFWAYRSMPLPSVFYQQESYSVGRIILQYALSPGVPGHGATRSGQCFFKTRNRFRRTAALIGKLRLRERISICRQVVQFAKIVGILPQISDEVVEGVVRRVERPDDLVHLVDDHSRFHPIFSARPACRSFNASAD